MLAGNPRVDPKRLAAIGFCFGGTTVLQLAYSGADLAGVVCFHGGLTPPDPQDFSRIKAKVLVLHGADDPSSTPEQVTAFQDAMRKAKADWQMVLFGGAKHAFTNPAVDKYNLPAAAYNEKAARRSWDDMLIFFREIFAQPATPSGTTQPA